MKRQLIFDIIFSLFILLFLYTGVNKIIDHAKFESALLKAPNLHSVAPLLSWVVPLGEIVIVLALIIPRTRRIGLIMSFITMAIFTIYIGFMLYFRSDRPCTCGGIIQLMSWHQHLYFNTGFTLLALAALWLDKKIQRQGRQRGEMKSISYIN